MESFESTTITILLVFLIGIMLGYFVFTLKKKSAKDTQTNKGQTNKSPESDSTSKTLSFESDFKNVMTETFPDFDNFADHMNLLNDINDFIGDALEISQSETATQKIISIKPIGVAHGTLDISLLDKQIIIRGENTTESNSSEGNTTSSFKSVSKFKKSFPIPDGVDYRFPEMDSNDDVVHLKFKKN